MHWWQFREPFSAWTHASWFLLSIPATIILWRRSAAQPAQRLTLMVFGVSLAACALASTLFHGVNVGPDDLHLYDRLDHVGIHLLIAGTYTPLAWNLLRGRWRWGTLGLVWSMTTVASVLLLAKIKLPTPLATAEYLALGWGALFCYVEIARILPHRVLRPLVLGGVFYSVGAVLNLLQWPEPWPGVIDAHGVFHLWVIAGSWAHIWFMLSVVIPFAHPAECTGAPQAMGRSPQASNWSAHRSTDRAGHTYTSPLAPAHPS
ncbi:MAG: hemolysin III family protein [Isosphaeraceae bacterium]